MVETSPRYCFKASESMQEKREIVIDPHLQPFVTAAERVINKLRKNDENIKEPIKNTSDNGDAQSWHWIDINTPGILAQSGLCLVLEPNEKEEVQVSVKTHINDNRIISEPLEWGREITKQDWKISDLKSKPDQIDTFETTISNSLRESFEDVVDKEIILIQHKKNLEKQSG